MSFLDRNRNLLIIAIVSSLYAVLIAPAFFDKYEYGSIGTNDFAEYWSAYQLFIAGKNPYSARLMHKIQQGIGSKEAIPIMMWNPPWLLTLISPVLSFEFFTSARVWLLLNLLMLTFCAMLLGEVYYRKKFSTYSLGATALFLFPIRSTLYFGQVSIFIALGICLLLWALAKKRHILAGLSLIPLTVKPQLVYLLCIVLAWWIIRHRCYKIFLSFVFFFTTLLIFCYFQSPTAFKFWFTNLANKNREVVGIFDWTVATGVGMTRLFLGELTDSYPTWPMVAIPGFTAVAVFYHLIKNQPELVWSEVFPLLLPLSLFTSPYGWVFDNVILLPSQVFLSALIMQNVGKAHWFITAFLLIGIQALAFVMFALGFNYQHHYFWIPLALLLLCFYTKRFKLA